MLICRILNLGSQFHIHKTGSVLNTHGARAGVLKLSWDSYLHPPPRPQPPERLFLTSRLIPM